MQLCIHTTIWASVYHSYGFITTGADNLSTLFIVDSQFPQIKNIASPA